MVEEKEVKERYELVELPTQTGQFVKDNENEEAFEDKRVWVEILNKLNKIEKAVA